ncbi:cellulase [Bacteroidia bacterium]|nr:cellulase [Bacteroidia bacterium]
MKKLIPLGIGLLLMGTACVSKSGEGYNPAKVSTERYQWKNVQIVGGGFVDGIIFHPKAKDVRYCRTDMGGAYRWNKQQQRWVSLLDWISYDDNNLVGVESIAVDPNDPQTVYISAGTYTRSPNGAVLISHDGGKTFTRIDMPFKMGGNENGRGNGERMMVDPANSNIIYLGTRQDGLWRSTDKGLSWEKVITFPDVTETFDPSDMASFRNRGSGVVFVVFDPQTAVSGKGSSTIYVGVSLMNRDNLFVSKDAGQTWQPVAGQPTVYRPTHGILSGDGMLYVTYGTNPGPNRMENGAVWKYDVNVGQWKEISPVKPDPENGIRFGYAAVSVDIQSPKHVIVSSFNLSVPGKYAEDDIFRSTDGGDNWKPVFAGKVEMDYSNAPYTEFTPLHWMFDIEIDPFDPNHAMFTTGYGGWETFNLNALDKDETMRWQIMSTGIEETVPLELYSPNEGAQLITGIGDYGGYTQFDLDKPDGYHTNPYFGNTNGLAGAENKPQLVVRVGTVSGHHREGKPLAYSEDGGVTWKEPDSIPGVRSVNGHIAVSADGNTWIWTPDRSPVYYTTDKGATWTTSEGIAPTLRVVADRVNPARFYAVDIPAGLLYQSFDGGRTFTADSILPPLLQRNENRGDRRGGQDRVYTTPHAEGELWIAAYDGLYHLQSSKLGEMVKLDKVRRMLAFGFGKEKPGSSYPALYMIGIVNGTYGFFRSDDAAKSWVRINDDNHQYGLVLHITGDPKKYGRVYVGTHGRGALYADPVK